MNRLTFPLAYLALSACANNIKPTPEAGYVWIPAGTFDMGCTPGQSNCYWDEDPHRVTLTHGYFIGATEVTQYDFEQAMGYVPAWFTACDLYGADCPVEQVSWYEAAAYANTKSHESGLQECYACSGTGPTVWCGQALDPYDCTGYRLLTEAEWEMAARCGEDLQYAGSTNISSVGWVDANSESTTHAVADLEANACGIYDMSGNVWEWTQDWYEPYELPVPAWTSVKDPVGAESGSVRVFRGGGWFYDASYARVSNRFNDLPERISYGLGFRIGRSIE